MAEPSRHSSLPTPAALLVYTLGAATASLCQFFSCTGEGIHEMRVLANYATSANRAKCAVYVSRPGNAHDLYPRQRQGGLCCGSRTRRERIGRGRGRLEKRYTHELL